jgi:hypothetical protein
LGISDVAEGTQQGFPAQMFIYLFIWNAQCGINHARPIEIPEEIREEVPINK